MNPRTLDAEPLRITYRRCVRRGPSTARIRARFDYLVRVGARKDGQPVGLDAVTRFIVDPKDLELDQPNADYALLRQVAEITGGQLLQPEDLDGFLQRIETLKLEDLTRVTILPLWDNVWVLVAFVGLMATEWALRKKWGLA